jgi:hypothetical protein
MSPRQVTRLVLAAVVPLAVWGCSSIGDLGLLQQRFVTDDMHAWIGQEAATRAGAPISLDKLTDDERTLRDLAYALIEPPYERARWDAMIRQYGREREFRRSLWAVDATAYYSHLQTANYRSTAGRYSRLIDDVRNDEVRIGPFFDMAHRVVELDRRRQLSLNYLPDIGPADRLNALARVGENSLTIAWVQRTLEQRCVGYRFALDHLVVAEPENIAAQADVALTLFQQQVAANRMVPAPRLIPADVAARPAPIVR